MHLRRVGAHRVALILTTAAVMCEISWASTQCKTIVMDVQMKRCRLGARARRGLERFDLLKYDEKSSKRQEGPDYSKRNTTPRNIPQKRQLSAERVAHIALPIVAEAINGAAKANEYSMTRAEYRDPSPSLIGRNLGRPGHYPPALFPLRGDVAPFRSAAFSDDLGLDLNAEELDELYNDIYKRIPRASKEEAWKIFLDTASKCCQNADKCLKEAMHVPCLAL